MNFPPLNELIQSLNCDDYGTPAESELYLNDYVMECLEGARKKIQETAESNCDWYDPASKLFQGAAKDFFFIPGTSYCLLSNYEMVDSIKRAAIIITAACSIFIQEETKSSIRKVFGRNQFVIENKGKLSRGIVTADCSVKPYFIIAYKGHLYSLEIAKFTTDSVVEVLAEILNKHDVKISCPTLAFLTATNAANFLKSDSAKPIFNAQFWVSLDGIFDTKSADEAYHDMFSLDKSYNYIKSLQLVIPSKSHWGLILNFESGVTANVSINLIKKIYDQIRLCENSKGELAYATYLKTPNFAEDRPTFFSGALDNLEVDISQHLDKGLHWDSVCQLLLQCTYFDVMGFYPKPTAFVSNPLTNFQTVSRFKAVSAESDFTRNLFQTLLEFTSRSKRRIKQIKSLGATPLYYFTFINSVIDSKPTAVRNYLSSFEQSMKNLFQSDMIYSNLSGSALIERAGRPGVHLPYLSTNQIAIHYHKVNDALHFTFNTSSETGIDIVSFKRQLRRNFLKLWTDISYQ